MSSRPQSLIPDYIQAPATAMLHWLSVRERIDEIGKFGGVVPPANCHLPGVRARDSASNLKARVPRHARCVRTRQQRHLADEKGTAWRGEEVYPATGAVDRGTVQDR